MLEDNTSGTCGMYQASRSLSASSQLPAAANNRRRRWVLHLCLFLWQYMLVPSEMKRTVPETAKSKRASGKCARSSLCECGLLIKPTWLAAAVSVELVGGRDNKSGRVEIVRNGVRGTICDDGFNNAAATVVCRQVRWFATLRPARVRRDPCWTSSGVPWASTAMLP